jgi:hypothetical protein
MYSTLHVFCMQACHVSISIARSLHDSELRQKADHDIGNSNEMQGFKTATSTAAYSALAGILTSLAERMEDVQVPLLPSYPLSSLIGCISFLFPSGIVLVQMYCSNLVCSPSYPSTVQTSCAHLHTNVLFKPRVLTFIPMYCSNLVCSPSSQCTVQTSRAHFHPNVLFKPRVPSVLRLHSTLTSSFVI